MHAPFFRPSGTLTLTVSLAATLIAAPTVIAGAHFNSGSGVIDPSAVPTKILNVTTFADTADADPGDGLCADIDGACSLRAAVQEANASGNRTRIRLQRDGVYVLTIGGTNEDAAATGDLDVTSGIFIDGRNATVDASALDRAFDVLADAQLETWDLTVRNGFVSEANGGGYRSAGTLILRRSAVLDCIADGAGASGGAIANQGGDLIVRLSTLSGNRATRAGGAIEANAGLTAVRLSEMSDNMTGPGPGNGGAFHLTGAGTVDVRQTLVRDNVAAREGGGLWNSAVGTMTITDCDILDNEANGTAADDGGGGLFNDGGTMEVVGALVRGNTATMGSGSGGGVFNNGGNVLLNNTRVEANTSNRAGGGVEIVAGTTRIERSRLVGNATGASPGNGGGLHLTGAGMVEVDRTDVVGNTAASEGGGLWNSAVGTMSIDNSDITGNRASGSAADNGGGGLFNDGGAMSVSQSRVLNNAADGTSGSGGGAFNNSGVLAIDNSTFEGNSSSRAGGGIEALAGTTSLDDSRFISNQTGPAPGNGGAFHLTGAGTVDVRSTQIGSNLAAAEGGGMWNSAVGTMTVVDCDIVGNTASGNDPDQGGGGLFNDGGLMNVSFTDIRRNDADGNSGSGGGVLNNQGDLVMTDCLVSANTASRAGGGVEANVGATTLDGVLLLLNETGSSPGNGGGLHLTGAGTVNVTNGRVFLNRAANEGGGLWNSLTGTMTVDGTDIFLNTAPTGADVFNDGGTFTVDGDPVPTGG